MLYSKMSEITNNFSPYPFKNYSNIRVKWIFQDGLKWDEEVGINYINVNLPYNGKSKAVNPLSRIFGKHDSRKLDNGLLWKQSLRNPNCTFIICVVKYFEVDSYESTMLSLIDFKHWYNTQRSHIPFTEKQKEDMKIVLKSFYESN